MKQKFNLMKTIDIVYCIIMFILLLSIQICVWVLRGSFGSSAWCFSLLILSPIAGIISIVNIVRLIIALIKKHMTIIKAVTLTLSLLAAFPLLILFEICNIGYPNSGNEQPAITIDVPLKNKSDLILLGGEDYKIHAIWGSECYAYDILKDPYDIKSNDLNDFGIYGEEVISPVSGTVIAAYDGEEDIPANQDHFLSLAGNYVYIEIEDTNTYLMFIHLMQNSVTVNVGDDVVIGDILGKVGNSGTTSEPHLHLQHQKENPLKVLYPPCAEGLPIIFKE